MRSKWNKVVNQVQFYFWRSASLPCTTWSTFIFLSHSALKSGLISKEQFESSLNKSFENNVKNMFHQIATKDSQIFKNFPKGKGIPLPQRWSEIWSPPVSNSFLRQCINLSTEKGGRKHTQVRWGNWLKLLMFSKY